MSVRGGASLVNQLTAEFYTPQELVDTMRDLERSIGRLDDTCAALSANLKAAKKDRDGAVAALRSVVREVKFLERRPSTKRTRATKEKRTNEIRRGHDAQAIDKSGVLP